MLLLAETDICKAKESIRLVATCWDKALYVSESNGQQCTAGLDNVMS